MKYRATMKIGCNEIFDDFDTVKSAEEWLDLMNNNLEHTTYIDEIDDNYKLIDGFCYTKGAE